MALTNLNVEMIKKAFVSGANNLSNNKEYINELNVFPVPDGDTGTNMTLTIMTAVAELNSPNVKTIDDVAKAISSGSLRGARGNSGVILSQLFRGFCKEMKGKGELSLDDIASGISHATETAYKAVMRPKEGTILTVARGMAEKADMLLGTEDDILEFLEQIYEYGKEVLDKTPELLPVLKEAGVVDSGGQGLMAVMEGILLSIKGEDVVLNDKAAPSQPQRGAGILEEIPTARPVYNMASGKDDISTADIKYGYCTEFIVMLEKEISDNEVENIKNYLLSIGDSLVCVADDELIKIHVHTDHPGRAFEKGLEYGQLTRCKVDNMREEHSERTFIENEKQKAMEQEAAFKQIKAERNAKKEKYGIVAVAAGDGMCEIFKEIGADYIIQGGQTMNPSTDDILNAIKNINAENIFIFPNNGNIILASEQAAKLCKDKKVYVIPSRNIPQGIGGILAVNKEAEPHDNIDAAKDAMQDIKSGEITFAVRDTSFDGKAIRKNNIMGISDKGIDAVGTEIDQVTKDLVSHLVDEDSGLISLFYGEDVDKEAAEELGDYLSEEYPDLDVDVRFGGQPIYYYIISVE